MKYKYVISILAEHTFDILQRISIVFSRNRVLIQQLNFESVGSGGCVFRIETQSDEKTMERIVKQLQSIFDLLEVNLEERKKCQNLNLPILKKMLLQDRNSL